MAKRTPSRGSQAIQYEDFRPKSELKEEEAANILLIQLPAAFERQQMKITFVRSSRLIRVVGERPISGNKWSRFNEAFPVPHNCDVQKIQAKFQNGVITITMPKLTITQPQKATSASTVEEEKQKIGTPQMPEDAKIEEKTQKGMEDIKTQKQTEGKKAESALSAGEILKGTKSKTQDEATSKDEKAGAKVGEQTTAQKENMEGCEKTMEPKQEETSKKRKANLLAGQSVESSKKRKEAVMTSSEKENGGKLELFSEKVKNGAAAAMKSVMELSEERQNLVNIGVTVLVIAALGAYVSYTYRSSGNSKD